MAVGGYPQVHALRGQVEAAVELVEVVDPGVQHVAGELRLGADEVEPGEPPDGAAAAVAADHPAGGERAGAAVHDHPVVVLVEAGDRGVTQDPDPEPVRAPGQHPLDVGEVDHQPVRGRGGQPGRERGLVELDPAQHDPGEVPGPRRRRQHPVRGPGPGIGGVAGRGLRAETGRGRADRLPQRGQQPPSVEGLHRGRGQPAHPERRGPPGVLPAGLAFEHRHRAARETQLAGEQQTDRARSHDHHVVHTDRLLPSSRS
ncbi:hypothetical protein GCM10009772_39680 [Pseudonocardia alni subsp. carboxydivorans]